ncbi:glycosyltransferase [Prevotella buccae]|uniref:glycosyltransferase family 2 protein n=1 Tax=Segatella buccae TaxID=28126 RepID=UPI001C5FEF24|nr:glycosyltransferase family 2 protein [Segatella buccae]MBW4870590.1 glycosyltransferase [Segatella buccae]
MIRFTIITCTYNAEAVVGRTLDSVLAQTYAHVEHLIIDGVSTDRTLQLAEDYRRKNAEEESLHEIVITSEPDRGLYDAMNKGIARATGDYLVFLNAGDTFPSADTLEFIAGSVGDGEENPGVLYGDTDIVNDEGRFLRHRRLSPPEHLSWRSFSRGMLVCHQSFYALTAVAREVRYNTAYRYSADVDWCIRVMKACECKHLPLKNLHAVVTHYLDGGMTVKNHRASLRERFTVMRSHYGLPTTVMMHLWFVARALLKR